jgi:hypothetical protein
LALVIIIDHSPTFRRTLAAVYRLIAAAALIFPGAKPPRKLRTRSGGDLPRMMLESDLRIGSIPRHRSQFAGETIGAHNGEAAQQRA